MTAPDPTTNGHGLDPAASAAVEDSPLAPIRQRPQNVHVLRGYGPLVVGAVLFVLMVLLAPTVAPERMVERPVDEPTTTTVDVGATTAGGTAP